ncbi:hypothetical protein D3C72_1779630 [compost metagenome]
MRAPAFVAELEILAVSDVEQVVQAERIVDGEAQVALRLAGRTRSRVVDRGDDRPWLGALDRDHHVADAGCGGRHDLHVGILAGYALHLLQPLLQVAQVEQVTGPGRKGTFPGTSRVRVGKAQLSDHPGHQRHAQCAGAQVLLGH